MSHTPSLGSSSQPLISEPPQRLQSLREVVFIDGALSDFSVLAQLSGENRTFIVLDPSRNGLEQILSHLQAGTELGAIHIVGHGRAGEQHIGTTILDENLIAREAQVLRDIGQSLHGSGDILLYGCHVAEGAKGQAMVQLLAQTTGADVAASTNLTGGLKNGGDSTLEFSIGAVDSETLILPEDFQALGTWPITLIKPDPPGNTNAPEVLAGAEVTPPFSMGNFSISWNGYAEDDSNSLAFGTHWTGRPANQDFVRAPYGDEVTEISIEKIDGSAFRAANVTLNYALGADGLGVTTSSLTFTGYRDGQVVTDSVTVEGFTELGGGNNIFINDPAFNNIDKLVISSDEPIRGLHFGFSHSPAVQEGSMGVSLSPGDIAMIGYDSYGGNDADAAFVALADLPGDHYIFFSTVGWNSSTQQWLSSNVSLVGESDEPVVAWKTPSEGVSAGTVFSLKALPGGSTPNFYYFNADWDLPDMPVRDQIYVFELDSAQSIHSPSFVYAANVSDQSAGDHGFDTAFTPESLDQAGVPARLVAAGQGEVGSAFGLIPSSAQASLKPDVLVDGMTREEALQAIHTTSNWQSVGFTEYDNPYDFSDMFDNIALATGALNEAPTLTNIDIVPDGIEDTIQEITFAQLAALADEADSDGTVDAFVIGSHITGDLMIGTDLVTAQPYASDTNDVIDATHNAYWRPNFSANGVQSAFSVVARDNAGVTSSNPVNVQVSLESVPDRPVMAYTIKLTPIAEDVAGAYLEDGIHGTGEYLGEEISALLVRALYGDGDRDLAAGIAISGNGATPDQGTWQYSTDPLRVFWRDVGDVSETDALLLGAEGTGTALRFIPSANYHGQPGGLTVHAVDQSDRSIIFSSWNSVEEDRRMVDITSSDLSFAVGTNHVNWGILVTSVNDAPVINGIGPDDAQTIPVSSGPVLIDQGTPSSVSDADNDTFAMGMLTVRLGAGLQDGDTLGIRTGQGVTLSNGLTTSSVVAVNGQGIGTLALMPNGDEGYAEIIVMLTWQATPELVSIVQQNFTFASSSDQPGVRTIELTLNDGETESTPATTTITVAPAPADPTVTISSSAYFLKAGSTATVTFTFDQVPQNFDLSDITVSHGSLSGLTASNDPAVYTATFTPTAETQSATGSISIAAERFENGHGDLNQASNTLEFSIDTKLPQITSIVRLTPSSEHTNADSVVFRIQFSEAVRDLHASDFLVQGGFAQISGITPAGDNAFDFTISGGQLATYSGTLSLTLSSTAYIEDMKFNRLPTDTAIELQESYTLDNLGPQLVNSTYPYTGTYSAGQNLDFTFAYTEPVLVNTTEGVPHVKLLIGSKVAHANYVYGSGSNTLTFRYVVQEGDVDTDGIVIQQIVRNGGSLSDAAGNQARDVTLNQSYSYVKVDGIAPQVTSVAVPADGVYQAGDKLEFTVNFDEMVLLDTSGGQPTLSLTVGSQVVYATGDLQPGAQSSISFTYVLQAGQVDADGVSVNGIALNGAFIKDAAGNHAELSLDGRIDSTSGIKVDAEAPAAPVVSIVDDQGEIQGEVTAGSFTDDTTLTLKGTAEPDSDVWIYDGQEHLATVAANELGFWTHEVSTGPHGTVHQYSAVARDAAGNESPASFVHTVTIDTQAPTHGAITRLDIKQPSGSDSFTVEVAYADNGSGIDPSSISVGDIFVQAPAPVFRMEANDATYDADTGIATYTFSAPEGGWNREVHGGMYFIDLAENEVRDQAGNVLLHEPSAHYFEVDFNADPVFPIKHVMVEHAQFQKVVAPITATDEDGDTLTYTLSGKDSAMFELNPDTNQLRFKEVPQDANIVYEVRVTADDGNGGLASQDFTITVLSDLDRDGLADKYDADMDGDSVDNMVEAGVLNAIGEGEGDGNGDDIRDSEQANVASYQVAFSDPQWTTVAVDEGLILGAVDTAEGASGLARNQTMPLGQVSYSVRNVEQGGTVAIEMFVDASLKTNSFFMYDEQAQKWITLGTAFNQAESNKTKIAFDVIDGGERDADGQANGVILIQGAVGVAAPLITSDAETSVAENNVQVSTVTATQWQVQGNLTYAISGGADAGAFEIDAVTGALAFKTAPDFESPADRDMDNRYDIEVTATDAQGRGDTQSLTVAVTNVNEAPVVSAPITASTEENVQTPLSVNLLGNVSEPDAGGFVNVVAESVTFYVDGQEAPQPTGVTLSFNNLSVDTSTGYDYLAESGFRTITATYLVADDAGNSTQQSAIITVNGVNDDPVAAEPIVAELKEGDGLQPVNLLQHVSDVDDGAELRVMNIVYQVNGGDPIVSNPSWANLNEDSELVIDTSDLQFQYLAKDQAFTLEISYMVSDEFSGYVEQTASIVIRGTNDAPTVEAPLSLELTEGHQASTLDLLESASDVDETDTLVVEGLSFTMNGTAIEGMPAGFGLEEGRFLNVDPSHEDFDSIPAGQYLDIVASYIISDGNDGQRDQTASFRIHGANDAPVVDGAIDETVIEGSGLQTVSLLQRASDVDLDDLLEVRDAWYTVQIGDSLISSAPDLPSGLTLTGSGELQIDTDSSAFESLAVGQEAIITVTYNVTDSEGAKTPASATVHVTGTNDAPEKVGDNVKFAIEGNEPGSFSFSLLDGVQDRDSGDELTLDKDSLQITVNGTPYVQEGDEWPGGPNGMFLVGSTLVVDPRAASFDFLSDGQVHEIVATYRVVDEQGASVAQSASITIIGTNDAPTLHVDTETVQRVTVGSKADLPDFVVADVDADDQLTLTLTSLNGKIAGLGAYDANPDLDGIQLVGTAIELNTLLTNASFTATRAGESTIELSLKDAYADPVTATYHLSAINPPEEPQQPQPPKPPVIPPSDQWEGLPDNDGDGIPESVENLVPGMAGGVVGDGNGDGIADILQTDVSSLPWAQTPDGTTRFVTLTNGAGLAQTSVKPLEIASGQVPANLNLPLGLLAFKVDKVPDSGSVDFTVYLDSDIAVNGYWKEIEGEWVNIARSITTEGGKTKISFTIEDGGRFDADGVKNGTIVDPGAPGWRTVASPGEDADGDQFPDALEANNGLTPGAKDNDVFASTKLFVMQLYRDFLYRESEPEGLAYWQARLDSGELTRENVAHTFLFASEFQDNAGAVARLYMGTYDRIPDNEGMHYWVDALQDGQSLTQVAEQFAASDEFSERYGDLDNEGFVSGLYLNVQGREAEAEGQAWWVLQLEAGMSRGDVLVRFTQSEEFVANSQDDVAVTLSYVGLLDRTPEQAGFDYWLGQIEAGRGQIEVIGQFIGTDEYHDRFLPDDAQ